MNSNHIGNSGGSDAAVLAAIAAMQADIDTMKAEVSETEHHLHNNEKWFGAAASASGETHVADRMGPGIAPFALLTGNDAFGSWVQILGSSDTPVASGKLKYDTHRILVTSTDSTIPFNVQIVSGESAAIAAKISAEDFTEFPYISATNNADSGISDVIDKRDDAGEKMWMRAICVGQDAKTINLYFGLHEYDA